MTFYFMFTCDSEGRLTSKSRAIAFETGPEGDGYRIFGAADVPQAATSPNGRQVREIRSRVIAAARVIGCEIPESLDGNLKLHPVDKVEALYQVHNARPAPAEDSDAELCRKLRLSRPGGPLFSEY